VLTKEQLQTFRAAPWTSKQDVGAYLATAEDIEPQDLVTLLGLLCDRGLAADPALHRMRCTVFGAWGQGVTDKSLFTHYFKALKLPDSALRAALVPLLPSVTEVSRQLQLCELFRSPDPELRSAAAQVLRQVGGSSLLVPLVALVREPDFPGRREVVELLVPLAGAWAIPVFQAIFEAGKPVEKRLCLRFLADPQFVGKSVTSALQAIRTTLDDPSEAVAVEGVAAFCLLSSEDQYFETIEPLLDADRLVVVKAAIAGLGRYSSPRAMAALERKFQDGPTDVRLAVLDTLETIATNDIVPLLVEALGRKSLKVRSRASDVMSRLSKLGKLDIGRSIIWLLRSGDVELRRAAADLARSVPDPAGRLWPKLLGFLRDEDWWVRERVVDALLELAGAQLAPLLSDYLADPSDVIRRFAVEILGRLKDPQTLDMLLRAATEDVDWWVRERAIEAMAAIGDARAVPHIVRLMQTDREVRVACLRALADLKPQGVAPEVAALLADPNATVRLSAVQALAAVNGVAFANDVRALAKDPVANVQVAALDLLARWNLPTLVQAQEELSALDTLLVALVERRGDDLILTPDRVPTMKALGLTSPMGERPLSAVELEALLSPYLSLAQLEDLKANRDVDFSHEVPSRRLRFRTNVFRQLGGISAVFRVIRGVLPDLAQLGLPPVVQAFGDFRDGLVLVGGPTGSGKSTTLAALIDYVNRTSSRHVISLEDPIEVLHTRRMGLVNQREIGTHTRGTLTALRSTLRQDPDVILVGEMRDLPTISFAVTAAETGHLVLGTVHTVSADTTVDRIVNAFPYGSQQQVRSMLADSLRAVVCQYLIPRQDGAGRVLTAEVLINNDAVANLIRKGKAFQIPSIIAISRERGMQSMDGELKRLATEGVISQDEAYLRAVNKKEFESPAGDKAAASAAGPRPA
jgi:twitching motility protein PilT